MPTKNVPKLLGTTAALFFFGMFFGNLILVSMSLIPLSFVLIGLAVVQPKQIEVRRASQKGSALVNEVIENRIDVEIKDGLGMVVLADELPEEFELVSGSNFRVVWKGRGVKREQIVYSVRCSKRGVYDLAGVRWESRHPLGLRQTEFSAGAGQRIVVRPRLLDVRKVRSSATASRIPFPSPAVAKIGPVTMDFREIRPYFRGDPFKFINWKATARIARRGRFLPVVNDYEREGMKIVWILLDRSSTMTVGPSVSNVFEHALGAVNGLAYYYLRRGCRVGLCVYNGGRTVLYPDAENRQHYRIMREILRLKPEEIEPECKEIPETEPEWPEEEHGAPYEEKVIKQMRGDFEKEAPEELKEAVGPPSEAAKAKGLREGVKACRGYAPGGRPLFIIVTRFTGTNAAPLLDGVKEIVRLTGTAGPRLPIMVVNVSGYGLAARSEDESVAGAALHAECVLRSKKFRVRMAWVDWDPTRESFTNAMLRQVVG